ncbi:TPM domain-containing protein [Lacibacter sediminis]|uniref:TPM domain-containing protein n=1 Tax=Lacibacter sediminis TaxID=2760713 RepID=A0A7G5XKL6_9BACT|nr:TPM domain-containing protein [Lacibacter sediminis]QNA46019.1 TPM domain-containing protein [Lacibacter sediminis]
MIAKVQIAVVSIFFLSFSSAFSQSTSRSANVPVFDGAKTDIDTYRKGFLKILPSPSGYVNDFENLFSENEESILDSLIAAFEAATTIEIALVTLDSSATARDNFDDLTLQIANRWGVGKKAENNGILIGISKGHRRIRIQNGYGIEKILSDEETKKIIEEYFIPEFKASNFYQGTLKGLNEMMRVLKDKISMQNLK